MQIFLGGEDRAFIEDLNMRDGRRKAQLVRPTLIIRKPHTPRITRSP